MDQRSRQEASPPTANAFARSDERVPMDTTRRPTETAAKMHSDVWINPAPLEGSEATPYGEDPQSIPMMQARRAEHDWTPFWLRSTTLLALIMLFAAMVASLIALWAADRAQNGFSTTISLNHYLWTYGPTAVLMAVMSLWRQVDYYCKIIQPWKQLSAGPAKAEDSVLLDYVSPFFATSLIRAVRRGHYLVASSVTGFVLLKGITLFSTGLLILTQTSLEDKAPVNLTTTFTGDGCVPLSSAQGNTPVISLERSKSGAVLGAYGSSSRPTFIYRSILNTTGSYPDWTQDGAVLQSFRQAPDAGVQTTSVEVDVFKPDISCEVADVTLRPNVSLPDPDIFARAAFVRNQYQLKTPSCLVGTTPHEAISLGDLFCGNEDGCVPWELGLSLVRINCSELAGAQNQSPNPTKWYMGTEFFIERDSTWDVRYAILMSNITWEDRVRAPDVGTLHDMTALICKPSYVMGRAVVTLDKSGDIRMTGDFRPSGSLDNIGAAALGELILGSVDSAALDGERTRSPDGLYADLLLEALPGERTLESLLVADDLQTAAIRLFNGIATQYVHEECMTRRERIATGSIRYNEKKLHVTPVSLWAMVVGLVLLSICTLVILRATSGVPVHQDPALISSHIGMLSRSRRTSRLLRNSGHLGEGALSSLLRGYRFETTAARRLNVIWPDQHQLAVSDTIPERPQRPWMPVTARKVVFIPTIVMPLVLIVVLEIVYHFSAVRRGIADITSNEELASSVSRYLSALVMFVIATGFNVLDFTISVFAPYDILSADGVPNTLALNFDLLGQLPPVAIWQSLRRRHLGPVLASVAGVLGAFLTIVSSGLWLAATRPAPISVEAFPTHFWNISWYNSSTEGDGGAGIKLNDVQHGSTSLPPTIWDSLVLPEISPVRFADPDNVSERESLVEDGFHLDVEALQAMLVCNVVPDEEIEISSRIPPAGPDYEQGVVVAKPKLPTGCWRGGPEGTNAFVNYTVYWRVIEENTYDFVTEFTDLHLGPWDDRERVFETPWDQNLGGTPRAREQEWGEVGAIDTIPDNPAGCPSIMVMYGIKGNASYLPTHDDIAVYLCSQKVGKVALGVTYYKNGTIDTRTPPIRRASPTQFLNNGTSGIETFPYRPETYLGGTRDFNGDWQQSVNPPSNLTGFRPINALNPFYNQVVYGPGGPGSPDRLAGRDNRPELINAVQQLYSKYMALVIDAKFRVPLSQDDSLNNPITGTLPIDTIRLQMNATSKIILQVFLASMATLGFVAYMLTNLRSTLPRNPTSIASVMSLLAGSDLCEARKELTAETNKAAERDDSEIDCDGWIVRLGWWSRGVGGLENNSEDKDQAITKTGSGHVRTEEIVRKRFGIDIGTPEQLGLRPKSSWRTKMARMRRRKAVSSQDHGRAM